MALTNIDEENVLLTLFAKKHSHGKLVTKVNRLEFDDILAGLDLGSVVYPKYMTCDYIVQYVRACRMRRAATSRPCTAFWTTAWKRWNSRYTRRAGPPVCP